MRQAWITLKLIWLYIRYWTIGLTEDYYYISKANYFYERGQYERAIRNYKRALKDANNLRLRIHDMIAYCYSLLGRDREGIDFYRKSFEETNDPLIGLGLARAELQWGNLEKCRDLINRLRDMNHRFDSSKLDALEAELQVIKKEREHITNDAEEFKRFESKNGHSDEAGRARRT